MDRVRLRVVSQGACLIWTGARFGNGYGEMKVEGRIRPVHRVVYERMVGPIPAGMQVLHRCDTPLCCNHDHLFLGTQADNMADMVSKGRGRGQFVRHER